MEYIVCDNLVKAEVLKASGIEEIALRMIRSGKLSNREIAEFLQIDVKTVDGLAKEQQAAVC